MGLPQTRTDDHFTYGLYRTWPDDERWELIDGVAYNMCAAPNTWHQEISARIFTEMRRFLKGKPCRAFAAPFDVLLPATPDQPDDAVDTVVQPDLVVFCDQSKITFAGARGAPDLAVEILSPWTMRKDFNEKLRLYERVGVREYWVVDPLARLVQVWRQLYIDDLASGGAGSVQVAGRFGEGLIVQAPDGLASSVLSGFILDLGELFADA